MFTMVSRKVRGHHLQSPLMKKGRFGIGGMELVAVYLTKKKIIFWSNKWH